MIGSEYHRRPNWALCDTLRVLKLLKNHSVGQKFKIFDDRLQKNYDLIEKFITLLSTNKFKEERTSVNKERKE